MLSVITLKQKRAASWRRPRHQQRHSPRLAQCLLRSEHVIDLVAATGHQHLTDSAVNGWALKPLSEHTLIIRPHWLSSIAGKAAFMAHHSHESASYDDPLAAGKSHKQCLGIGGVPLALAAGPEGISITPTRDDLRALHIVHDPIVDSSRGGGRRIIGALQPDRVQYRLVTAKPAPGYAGQHALQDGGCRRPPPFPRLVHRAKFHR